ncbi:MAG: OmpA family protein [Ignavibacteriales bacterium]|nr:OmpA family protein [Ignavibacteriales bacterium]
MIKLNTVLNILVKDRGYTYHWQKSEPTLPDDEIDNIFRKIDNPTYGFNTGFCSAHIAHDLFLLITTSKWDIRDEFNRVGVSLSEGILIRNDFSNPQHLLILFENFVSLLRSHRIGYTSLRYSLEYIAQKGEKKQVNDLLSTLTQFSDFQLDNTTTRLLQPLSCFLDTLSLDRIESYRVFSTYPWNEDLCLYFLLGLQLKMPFPSLLGGGYLTSYNEFNHISSSTKVDGFKDLDIGTILQDSLKFPYTNRFVHEHPEHATVIKPTNRLELPNRKKQKKAIQITSYLLTFILGCVLTIVFYTIKNTERGTNERTPGEFARQDLKQRNTEDSSKPLINIPILEQSPILPSDKKPELIVNNPIVLKGVNFETNSSNIPNQSEEILNQLYTVLNENIEYKIEICGYTDSIGSEETNRVISQKRADAIMLFLVEKGVNPLRISTEGLGEKNPIASNQTEEGRQQNRRIEVMQTKCSYSPAWVKQGLIGVKFTPSGWLGDGVEDKKYIQLDDEWKQNPHSPTVSLKVSYQPGLKEWGGVYWQNIHDNAGDKPGDDFCKYSYRKLTFWARGEDGGEVVEFKAGGINVRGKSYKDSFDTFPSNINLESIN